PPPAPAQEGALRSGGSTDEPMLGSRPDDRYFFFVDFDELDGFLRAGRGAGRTSGLAGSPRGMGVSFRVFRRSTATFEVFGDDFAFATATPESPARPPRAAPTRTLSLLRPNRRP